MLMKFCVTKLERLVSNMGNNLVKKLLNQKLRKSRVRSSVYGTSIRPRMSVKISNKQVSAQIIDDSKQHTIVASSSVGNNELKNLTEKASFVGTDIAKKAKKVGLKTVVFDRNGRRYAKRLIALADAARKEGLEF